MFKVSRVLILAMSLAAAFPALAQEAAPAPGAGPAAIVPPEQQATREQLQRLFEVMRIRQQMANVLKTMPMIAQQAARQQAAQIAAQQPESARLTPAQQAERDKLMQRFFTKAMNMYPVDEMLNDMAAVYRRHLSRDDVDALIAFHTSPAGQHLLDAQPAILQEYMPMVMQRVQERSKALAEELKKDIEEQQKSSAAPNAGTGRTSTKP
jgi:hypothetical protein